MIYAEDKGDYSVDDFSRTLAQKISEVEVELPRGNPSSDASARISQALTTFEII